MTNGRKIDKKVVVPGLALLAMFVIGADAPVFAQRDARATRSSGSSAAPRVQSSNSSSSSRASTSAAPGRSAAPRSSARSGAARTRQSTPASRGRRGGSHRYRSHHHNYGLHFGYGRYYGWGGYNWGGYYDGSYYYPYFHPFYWGVPHYAPRRVSVQHRLGAFDLNVRPKKAEVYLDGEYIGTAGQFDGFPEHLWLERGTYELIFYRPGLGTEKRVLSIYPGVVVDVRLRLQPGESVAPSELTTADRSGQALAEVRSAYQSQTPQAPSAAPPTAAELDTRAAPGRVRLSVLPADASVYLDGRLLGSGDELGQLHAGLVVDAGSHLLEVVRPGYASQRLEFKVSGGDDLDLEVLLEAG
jgi:hypothetical protein